MNKNTARAIMRFSWRTSDQLDRLWRTMSPQERKYANVRWAGRLRKILNGFGRGSMPIEEAGLTLIDKEEQRVRRRT